MRIFIDFRSPVYLKHPCSTPANIEVSAECAVAIFNQSGHSSCSLQLLQTPQKRRFKVQSLKRALWQRSWRYKQRLGLQINPDLFSSAFHLCCETFAAETAFMIFGLVFSATEQPKAMNPGFHLSWVCLDSLQSSACSAAISASERPIEGRKRANSTSNALCLGADALIFLALALFSCMQTACKVRQFKRVHRLYSCKFAEKYRDPVGGTKHAFMLKTTQN